MTRSIGRTLRDLRRQRGLSLSEVSEAAGVSTSMLSQVENGRSTPTVVVLWKIAHAFDVPMTRFLADFEAVEPATVLRRQEAPVRISGQGRCIWRNLAPDAERGFFELTLKEQASEEVPALAERDWTFVAVIRGEVAVTLDGHRYALGAGDVLKLAARLACSIGNPGTGEAVLHLVSGRSCGAVEPV
jgi:transcriptional regulator with XRE-family HTH domain